MSGDSTAPVPRKPIPEQILDIRTNSADAGLFSTALLEAAEASAAHVGPEKKRWRDAERKQRRRKRQPTP